ncbi:MAG: AMP-binding protein [Actinomycetota bacterium]
MSERRSTSDHRIPDRDDVVFRYLIERRVRDAPDQVFAVFEDGSSWTHQELLDATLAAARGFQQLGVRQGDHVASFLPHGTDALRVWFGLNYLGAVYVPINPSYRGNLLAHVIANSDASVIVASDQLLDRLDDVDLADLRDVVTLGQGGSPVGSLASHPGSTLARRSGDLQPLDRPIEPWDTQAIWYTSGTTGPSKGVLSSYLHAYSMFGREAMPFIDETDRYMINMPVFHMGGAGLTYSMLVRGGSVAFLERFSATGFIDQTREMGATVVFLLGVMASFVESQPPRPDDSDNPLRTVFIIPVLDDMARFATRFGCDVYSIFNMTEIATPIVTEANPRVPGTCGRLRDGFDVRLVDENDCEVPLGEVGEFVVRADRPFAMNHGYYKMPEATARAWRNGWFHTGDAGRRDADGNYFFVDRIKDVVRRRGENISSLELEIELTAHAGIAAAAIVGVPSRYAEEEVLAVCVGAGAATPSAPELIDFLAARVADFMIPRYVRFVDELPMTPTEKVRKVILRGEGITVDTWDREAST